jgi:TDG/mug DNA glycosylase family protein
MNRAMAPNWRRPALTPGRVPSRVVVVAEAPSATAGSSRPRPTPADLEAARDATIPDVLTAGLRVVFAGINPGLYSAATGHHFARPGNRFWPALYRSGFTPRQFRPDEQDQLLALGLGITNVAPRATARAAELAPAELRAGALELQEKMIRLRPQWLAVLGVTVYRTAFGHPEVVVGPQADVIGPTRLWVLPNPSGLNASWPTPKLTEAYRDLRLHAEGHPSGDPAGPGWR